MISAILLNDRIRRFSGLHPDFLLTLRSRISGPAVRLTVRNLFFLYYSTSLFQNAPPNPEHRPGLALDELAQPTERASFCPNVFENFSRSPPRSLRMFSIGLWFGITMDGQTESNHRQESDDFSPLWTHTSLRASGEFFCWVVKLSRY